MADLKIDIVANASNALKGIDAVIDSPNKLRTAVAKAGNKDVGGIVSADTTKAAEGHDMPITNAECQKLLGDEIFGKIRDASLALYDMGLKKAQSCGIILADTKFEFGTDAEGKVYLIDEVLTPDSSRYWPADKYEVGRSQPSYDKQYVRDWLETLDWNKQAPGPVLPPEVVQNTIKCYSEALSKLMGK